MTELTFNLGILTDEDTWIEVVHPETGKPIVSKTGKSMAFKTRPPQSDEAQAVAKLTRKGITARLTSRMLKQLSGNKMTQAELSALENKLADEQIEATDDENIKRAQALITDWRLVNYQTQEDLDVPCNAEAIAQLFNSPSADPITAQWNEAVNLGNYALVEQNETPKGSAKNTSPSGALSKTESGSSSTSPAPGETKKLG